MEDVILKVANYFPDRISIEYYILMLIYINLYIMPADTKTSQPTFDSGDPTADPKKAITKQRTKHISKEREIHYII